MAAITPNCLYPEYTISDRYGRPNQSTDQLCQRGFGLVLNKLLWTSPLILFLFRNAFASEKIGHSDPIAPESNSVPWECWNAVLIE